MCVRIALTRPDSVQVETLGQKCDALKWTLEKGLQQLKLKMVVPGRQFVLGVDSHIGARMRAQQACTCVNAPQMAFVHRVCKWSDA